MVERTVVERTVVEKTVVERTVVETTSGGKHLSPNLKPNNTMFLVANFQIKLWCYHNYVILNLIVV